MGYYYRIKTQLSHPRAHVQSALPYHVDEATAYFRGALFRWPIPSRPYHLSGSPPQPSPAQLNLSCLGRPIPTAGLAA
eukprot:scaffold3130_cov65-Phaeocystis_antarctica.AAC.2